MSTSPPLSPTSSLILQQAQRRNQRRHQQRRKRIQARFNSDLPELKRDLANTMQEGKYLTFCSEEMNSFGCVGVAEMQGRRPSMEDTHALHLHFNTFLSHIGGGGDQAAECEPMDTTDGENRTPTTTEQQSLAHDSSSTLSTAKASLHNSPTSQAQAFLGVYDGHGGADAAKYTQQRLHIIFASKLQRFRELKVKLLQLAHQKEEFRLQFEQLERRHSSEATQEDQTTSDDDKEKTSDQSNSNSDSAQQDLTTALNHILQQITELKFHFSELVKRVSYQMKAPEIEHVIDEDEDEEDSSDGWDSDEESDSVSSSGENANQAKVHDSHILVEQSLEPLQLELYSEEDAIQLLLRESFLEVNDEMREKHIPNGCTASVVYMQSQNRAFVANVGDSRVVLCRNGKPLRLSIDHRPSDTSEKDRIRSVGGYVSGGRVNGIIAVTRALGDCFLEPMVTADPSTMCIDLRPTLDARHKVNVVKQSKAAESTSAPDPFTQQEGKNDTTAEQINTTQPENTSQSDATSPADDNFLIVACDGLWDFVSEEKAIEIIQDELDPRVAAVRLRNYAYETGSTDNISVCVFRFGKPESFSKTETAQNTETTTQEENTTP